MNNQKKSIYQRFAHDPRGSITIMFALSLVVLIGIVGLTVDLGRGYNARSSLQNSLDSALLAAAMESLKEDGDVQAAANAFIKNNWKDKFGIKTPPSVSVSSNSAGSVQGSISVTLPNYFLPVLNIDTLKVSTNGSVSMGLGEVEIALALDTTESMSGSKLTSLKDAADLLVETIMPDSGGYDNVKIGIVPFGRYVNVGLQYRDESWIDVPADYTTNICNDTYPNPVESTCTTNPNATCYNDGVPYTCSQKSCGDWGEPVEQCSTSDYSWYGCVGSRNHPKNVKDISAASPVPGILGTYSKCGAPLTRLTNNKSEISSQIDGLSTKQDTYIPSGLMWAWRVLSKVQPFDDGVSYNDMNGGASVRKAIVLMTDGANTRSPSYPKNSGYDVAEANDLTAELCANIKATGTEIFTVTFEVFDVEIKDLMESCASNAASYFDADNGAELSAAFKSIGTSLAQLRLSK